MIVLYNYKKLLIFIYVFFKSSQDINTKTRNENYNLDKLLRINFKD